MLEGIIAGEDEVKYQYKDLLMMVATQLRHAKKDKEEMGIDEEKQEPGAPFPTDDSFDKSLMLNPSKEELLKSLGRKKVDNLTTLKPFVDVMKYKTSSKSVSICPLSTTSKFWKIIYKAQKNVSNLLGIAQKIGLIYCVDEKVRFNSWKKEMNSCKKYAWNKSVEHQLLSLFKEYGIGNKPGMSHNETYVISILARFANGGLKGENQLDLYNDLMKRFKIRIVQQTRLPLKEEYLIKGLTETYPQYMEMVKTIDEDNGTMDIRDYDYAIPSFTYNKDGECTKIGIRKTNQYCNLKVHNISWETMSREEKARTRDGAIRSRLGGVYENDVKSSIYRITYLLNKGVWLDRRFDFYRMMAGFEMTPQERDLYKAPLAMKLYFSGSIKKAIATSVFQHEETKKLFDEVDAYTLLTKAWENMFKVIGRSYRSEIFLHESCIYTQVAHRIRQKGYKLIQIYDGFFTDRYLPEDQFDEIVRDCALEYYNRWWGHWYAA